MRLTRGPHVGEYDNPVQASCGMMAGMTAVAVVGLGAMGSRVARRFLDAGHEVLIWNRTPDKMTPLTDLGGYRLRAPPTPPVEPTP